MSRTHAFIRSGANGAVAQRQRPDGDWGKQFGCSHDGKFFMYFEEFYQMDIQSINGMIRFRVPTANVPNSLR